MTAEIFLKNLVRWEEAIYNGILGIEELGGCVRGDKTMLDALYPVYDVLKNKHVESGVGIEHVVDAAREGAEQTRNVEAKAGRARYVKGKGIGKVDPGAFAVYLLLRAFLQENDKDIS